MVVNDTVQNEIENKKNYLQALRYFGSIPLNKTSLIVNVIASYYAKKYLNRNLNGFSELPSQDTIDKIFVRVINYINDSFIIDRRLVLNRIRDYIQYYRVMTFHEFVPDEKPFKISEDFKDVDPNLVNIYYNLGYSTVLSVKEFNDIASSSDLFRKLSESFALGAKYLKQYVDMNNINSVSNDTFNYTHLVSQKVSE